MAEYRVVMEYMEHGMVLTMIEYPMAETEKEAVEIVWEKFIEKFYEHLVPDDLEDVKVEVCRMSVL